MSGRHHWSVPVPDGSAATAAIFRLSSSNVLIISTSTNQIHVLDVEVRELSEWSVVNGPRMTESMLEFPGPIIGLSVPPTSTSTAVIAYSSRFTSPSTLLQTLLQEMVSLFCWVNEGISPHVARCGLCYL